MDLSFTRIFLEKSYKIYYKKGNSVAYVKIFTNMDDYNQESIELAYDNLFCGILDRIPLLNDRL
jgi:hypothetical protein